MACTLLAGLSSNTGTNRTIDGDRFRSGSVMKRNAFWMSRLALFQEMAEK